MYSCGTIETAVKEFILALVLTITLPVVFRFILGL
jgi:hypothetical protein